MNNTQGEIERKLERSPYLVRKIGGDNAQNLRANVDRFLDQSRDEQKQVLVVSAIRSSSNGENFNTTDRLIDIAEALEEGDFDRAEELFGAVKTFTSKVIAREVEDEHREALDSCLERECSKFSLLLTKIRNAGGRLQQIGEDKIYHDSELGYRSITGFGEHLAQCLYQEYLTLKGVSVSSLDSSNLSTEIFGDNAEQAVSNRGLVDELRSKIRIMLDATFGENRILVSGGYLPGLGSRRGYSDKTAALYGLALKDSGADCLLVMEKNHPILSADPATIDIRELQCIPRMSLDLATELFGSRGANAAAIHPDVMAMLKGENVDVVITNPDEPERGSTTISDDIEFKQGGVEIIAKRSIPSALVISSGDMIASESVLAAITNEFSDVVIDQVMTSEQTITITFNSVIDDSRATHLEAMLSEQFESKYKVEHRKDLALVFCLGNNINAMREMSSALAGLTASGQDVIFSSGNELAQVVTFVVLEDQADESVMVLHKTLIPQRKTLEESNFLNREAVLELQRQFPGPMFVYSETLLREAAQRALAFQSPHGLTVRYAMKANPNRTILQLFHSMGVQIDASSGFEAQRAMLAGIPGKNIMLTAQECPENLHELVNAGMKFNACSLSQLCRYGELFPGTNVSVRINPGKGDGFHPGTKVAGSDASFGIWHADIPKIQAIASEFDLTINQVHTHIGSGTNPEVWEEVAETSIALLEHFPEATRLSLGGGFKVARMSTEKNTDLEDVSGRISQKLEDFARTSGREIHLEIEPGTYLTANAGSILANVSDMKDTGLEGHRILILNIGMNNILRPGLYGAEHPLVVIAAEGNDAEPEHGLFLVAGHCCEGTDMLTPQPKNPSWSTERLLQVPQIGDFMLIEGAGAYCSSLAAGAYNSFPSIPEVLVRGDGSFVLIKEGETMEQMLKREVGTDLY